jgi:hypothetical protein
MNYRTDVEHFYRVLATQGSRCVYSQVVEAVVEVNGEILQTTVPLGFAMTVVCRSQ